MRSTAKDHHAHAFERTDGEVCFMPRYARMRETVQITIRDRHAIHFVRDMAKARPKDQPHADLCITRARG